MNWTTPADVKAQLSRLWNRGYLPRLLITGERAFPLRLALKSPGSSEVTERFGAVRNWAAAWVAVPHLRVEWRDVRHRIQGAQCLPHAIWVDSMDDALGLLGKHEEAARLSLMAKQAATAVPDVLPWLARRPLRAIELANAWPQLLAVTKWMVGHPRPGIYLRQVDVPGVHSKFIETHRHVLSEWFDLVLPESALDQGCSGISQFAARYGFLDKPARIRFRILDARVSWVPGVAEPDVTLDAASFARLDLSITRVFITENETNFLAFPSVPDAIVIFGAGYGWNSLAQAAWLGACTIYYWGDIDTHGFAILDQLRHRFPNVLSLLMDRATLETHRMHWSEERDQVVHGLTRLTGPERVLFDDLRDNRIGRHVRLEQERIGFRSLVAALSNMGLAPGASDSVPK